MTQTKLEKLLKIWQKRLRLQDWDLTVKFVKQIEGVVSEGRVFGGTQCKPSFMEASIQILDNMSDKESELTLIHELIHVVFGGMQPPDGLFDHMFEVGIEKCARVLLGVYDEND